MKRIISALILILTPLTNMAGFNIADLMNNLPADIDPGLKKYLPEKIKKYFSELFKR